MVTEYVRPVDLMDEVDFMDTMDVGLILRNLVRPPAGNDSLFGVETHRVFAQGVQIAEERVLPAGEGEECHGGGHAYVDSHHAGGYVLGEFAGGGSGAGENGSRVAVLGTIDDGKSLFQGLHANHGEHRAENFFLGNAGIGIDAIEDGGADKIACGAGHGVFAAVGPAWRLLSRPSRCSSGCASWPRR